MRPQPLFLSLSLSPSGRPPPRARAATAPAPRQHSRSQPAAAGRGRSAHVQQQQRRELRPVDDERLGTRRTGGFDCPSRGGLYNFSGGGGIHFSRAMRGLVRWVIWMDDAGTQHLRDASSWTDRFLLRAHFYSFWGGLEDWEIRGLCEGGITLYVSNQ